MAQSKAFVDASHSLNELSHALALLESENSSLRGAVDGFTSENAKLRSQCTDLVDERERLFRTNVEKNGEILRLAAENAKLRELVRDMWLQMLNAYDPKEVDDFADRVNELGIEVTK